MKDRIKQIRIDNNLSMQAFADRINVSKGTISLWESGQRNVLPKMVKPICKEFNINETWLLTGKGDMHAPLSREAEIAQVTADLYYGDESYPFMLEVVKYLNQMTKDQWDLLFDVAKNLAEIKEKYDNKKDTE